MQLGYFEVEFGLSETLDIWIGCALLVVSVVSIIVLVLMGRRTIERIAAGKARSAREIKRQLRGE